MNNLEEVFYSGYGEGLPCGSVAKNPPANVGDMISIPGLGRSLEMELAIHSYSCLGNPIDGGA